MILTKKEKVQKKYTRRFYKYFLSYITLLVVVLLILGVVVYRNFIQTLQTEVEKSDISMLTQIKNTMDLRFREIQYTAVNISLDPDLKPYKVIDGTYNSLEAVKILNKYKSSNEFVYNISLFHNYHDSQKIFTPTMYTSLDMYFDSLYVYKNWSKTSFLNDFKNMSAPIIRPAEPVTVEYVNKKNYVTYIYPLPLNTTSPNSAVIFLIAEDTIEGMLKPLIKGYSGYIYILDEKNTPVTYTSEGKMDLGPLHVLKTAMESHLTEGINNVNISGKSYSVVKVVSDYNNWSYLKIVPADQFMHKVYTNRNLFNYAVFIVFILGIIFAFTLSTSQYTPWRNLVKVVSVQSKDNSPAPFTDEVAYISNAINEVSMENKGLMNQLKSKATIMKRQLLISLLRGKPDSIDQVKSMGSISGLKLDYPYFSVMVFLVDDYLQFKGDKSIQNLILFSIVNVIEELAQETGCGFGVELENDEGVALLLNIKEEFAKERYISELAFKTKDFFKQHYNFTLTIGVGSIYDKSSLIHESFLEANRAVYYRLVKGNDNVIFYEDIKDHQKTEYKYPVEVEGELVMAIKQGNTSEVERATAEIKNFLKNSEMSPESVQCISFGIINAVLKCMDEMDIDIRNCFEDEKEVLFSQPFETIDALGNRIFDFCNNACNYVSQHKESKNFNLRNQILDIVNQQYNDTALSLEYIAGKFGLSPSYVSRYFKNQTGYPLMQYIDMLRMNQAKQLLKQSNLPLKEILDQVGYVDESNFIRKFRKKEGVTPKQFRTIIQNKSTEEPM